jgi:Leucine-rich repeat (LRR) protein
MTTTGVLDDEALELALKDASVKGKLSLAYLDLTEITPEQATRIRAGAPNITELDLRSNNLTGLPDELGDLRALRVVKLDYNKLEHLPALLTKLPLLTNLQMGGNLLSTVDASVAELRALTDLDLSGNRLITVDPAIARCEKLVYLNLENNMLAALPPEIGSMQNLRVLDLSNCQLATLPDTVSGLTSLTRLEVNNNMLKTLPPSMGRLENLKDLDCRYNLLQEPEKSKAEGPVRGYLEYLKEEEERIIQEEIERLKPVATEAGSYLEYRMKLEDEALHHLRREPHVRVRRLTQPRGVQD